MLPDPGYLYLSKKHQMALTMLEYSLYNNAGFCIISGEIGAGKTTLLRRLLEGMEDQIAVGMITNTHSSFGELLDWVLSAFNIHKPGLSRVEMNQVFLDFMLDQYAKQKTVLLIVDEAQNLSVDTMEELRMLSNINSGKDQILQVILAGQPELKDTLRLPVLRQFAQRIAVDYHLGALSVDETTGYIHHRLTTAGANRTIFTLAACERIHLYSGGVPRLINLLCDTSMVYGFADQAEIINEFLVDEMVRERMADSLVPIVQQAHPDNIDTEEATGRAASPAKEAGSSASSKLSKISPEQKKQSSGSPAEKKTITDTWPRQPVAVHPQAGRVSGQHASARLQAVATQPQQDFEEEPAQIAARASEPEVAEVRTADPESTRNNNEEVDSKTASVRSKQAAATAAAASGKRDENSADSPKPEETAERWKNRVEVVSVLAPAEEKRRFNFGKFSFGRFPFNEWSIGGALVLVLVVVYFLASGPSNGSGSTSQAKPQDSSVASTRDNASDSSSDSAQAATSNQDSYAARVAKQKALQHARQQAIAEALKSTKQAQPAQKESQADVAAAKSAAEAKAKVQAKLEAELEAKLKSKSQAKAEADAKAKALAKAKAKAKAKAVAAAKARQEEARRKAQQARAAQQAKAAAAQARAAELEARLQAEQQAAAQARAQAKAAQQQAREAQAQARELQLKQQQMQASQQVEATSSATTVSATANGTSAVSENTVASTKQASTVVNTSHKQVVDPELEFTTDPCQGPSAKFLSTCRK